MDISTEQLAMMQRVSIAQKLIKDMKADTATHLLNDQIRHSISLIYGENFRPKDAQVACIRKLIYDATGVILIVPTGFEKSVIIKAVPILRMDATSIIFLPLNEIAEQLSQEVDQIGGRAVLFNANIKKMHKEIRLAKDGHWRQ